MHTFAFSHFLRIRNMHFFAFFIFSLKRLSPTIWTLQVPTCVSPGWMSFNRRVFKVWPHHCEANVSEKAESELKIETKSLKQVRTNSTKPENLLARHFGAALSLQGDWRSFARHGCGLSATSGNVSRLVYTLVTKRQALTMTTNSLQNVHKLDYK